MSLHRLLAHLDTPCLLLDQAVVSANVRNMQVKANEHRVTLRPHLKTAKSVAIADLFGNQKSEQGITVSTLREAEYFADAGFKDILYAVSLEPGKFSRILKLYRSGVHLCVIVDSIEVAEALAAFAVNNDVCISVMIEIDVDGHRCGLKPEDDKLIELATYLADQNAINFVGMMTHGGGSYDCQNMEQVARHAKLEQDEILKAKQHCINAGIKIPRISIGSTPTVVAATSFTDIDEIRPGVFVFFDVFQMQLGVCRFEDIALSVLCSVVAHKEESNTIIVDAGGLALSKDRSTSGTSTDVGYGLVADIDGGLFTPQLCIAGVNQEHGIIHLPKTLSCQQFPIGRRLRIYPNHACMTAAAYDGYVVIPESENLPLDYWGRCNGW